MAETHNFEIISEKIRSVAGPRQYYDFRSHIPLLGRAVCVGCQEQYDGSEWGQTARIRVALEDDHADMMIDDFRRDDNGRRIQIAQLSFKGTDNFDLGLVDGLFASLNANEDCEVAGLKGDSQIPLDLSAARSADFALACRLAIQMHADRVVRSV